MLHVLVAPAVALQLNQPQKGTLNKTSNGGVSNWGALELRFWGVQKDANVVKDPLVYATPEDFCLAFACKVHGIR